MEAQRTWPPDLEVPPMDHTVKYGGCMQRCTSVCLRHLGIDPPVALGRYWRFLREWGPPFRHKSLVMDGAFHVHASFFDDARDALAARGVQLTYCQGMGREVAWEWVTERVRGGQPVAVLLDSFYLPVYANFYQRVHLTHVYVLARVDGDTAYLLNPRHEVEVWPTAVDVVLTAWAREEYEWYEIVLPNPLPAYTTDDLRADELANVHGMLPDHPGEHWTKGVPAIRRFADELTTYPDRFGDLALKDVLEDGFHQLPGLREQRWLHGAALRLIALQLQFDELHEVGRMLEAVGQSWSVARNWFVRAAEMDDMRRGVGRLSGRLRQVADAEEEAATRLRAVLESDRWPAGQQIDLRLREVPEPV
jgi:hypothetical protein